MDVAIKKIPYGMTNFEAVRNKYIVLTFIAK